MNTRRWWQVALGAALAAAGVVLVFSPHWVSAVTGRPAGTLPQVINLRATWGGTLAGLGAFVAWIDAARPWRRALGGLLMWLMASIGAARATGFALDGGPDRLQWIWLGAEVVLALVGAALVRGTRSVHP